MEERGEILCTGPCTSVWKPLHASANQSDSTSGDLDLGVVTRPDGREQLTYDGLPLYTFTQEGPGELDGNGIVDEFRGTRFEWVAATTGGGTGSAGSDAPAYGSGY